MMGSAAGTTVVILAIGGLIGPRGLGTSAQGERAVSSGVYTADQATRGSSAYQKSCSVCHMDDLSGDQFATPLVGEIFAQRWQDSNLGELFTIVKATMPANNPGSLADGTYADIVAYLLMVNRYPAGGQEMSKDPEELAKITFKKP